MAAVLSFVFCSHQPNTNETTDTGILHCVVCLFTHQLLLVVILPTPEDGQAELTWVVDETRRSSEHD